MEGLGGFGKLWECGDSEKAMRRGSVEAQEALALKRLWRLCKALDRLCKGLGGSVEALERLWKGSGEALDLIRNCYPLLKVNRDLLFPIKR